MSRPIVAESRPFRANEPLPVLSLFSGPGGLDLGFEQAGFLPLLAIDRDEAAVDTYNLNHPKLDMPARVADLVTTAPTTLIEWWEEKAGVGARPIGVIGGPPCQAFSEGNVHQVKGDPRAHLPFAYADILREFNSTGELHFFVLENVRGLGLPRHRAPLQAFMREFRKAGFGIIHFCLNAASFGVPQNRKRIFIVGFNRALYRAAHFRPPSGNGTCLTVRQAIGFLPEPTYFARGLKAADIGFHPNHWCMNPRSPKFARVESGKGELSGRSFRLLKWDTPSWTVAYGHREVHVHPSGRRRLSVYEAMLLQGFPPDYQLTGNLSDQFRMVSDAVPPPLARELANIIRAFMYQERSSANLKSQPSAMGQAS